MKWLAAKEEKNQLGWGWGLRKEESKWLAKNNVHKEKVPVG